MVLSSTPTTYNPMDSPREGWSIECETIGNIDYVKYFLDNGDVKTHYSTPFWINGDNSGNRVNRFEYLGRCGSKKIVVKFYNWNGGDNAPCDTTTLQLSSDCATPTKSPVKAPVPAPTTMAPVMTPTMAPVKAPTCNNFHCPMFSNPKHGITCIDDFEDCKCVEGYEKKDGTCLKICPNFQCPVLSNPKAGLSCINDFNDCDCISGYEKKDGACVKICPNFQCPVLSNPKSGLSCINDFGDCDCISGYEKKDGACVKICPNFQCPANSSPIAGLSCISSFDNCSCNQGYEKYGGQCVVSIPPITYCSREAFYLFYKPNVPAGWLIEALRAGTNDSRQITITDSHATSVYIGGRNSQIEDGTVERWFHSFRFGAYYLRFKDTWGRVGEWKYCTYNTPIGLDINNSGAIERISGTFEIDITGDGDIETLYEWFAPTEGILIDTAIPIVNGVITGLHLFGNSDGFEDGFAKLRSHDDNIDGHIEGAELETFAIWMDANSNVKVDDGELSTLASHSIVSLNTFHESYASEATLEDGTKMYMEDLWFTSDSNRF